LNHLGKAACTIVDPRPNLAAEAFRSRDNHRDRHAAACLQRQWRANQPCELRNQAAHNRHTRSRNFSQVDNPPALGQMARESPTYRRGQQRPRITRESGKSSFNIAGSRTRRSKCRAIRAGGDEEPIPFRTHDGS
jgi:hypothetical protein